MPDWAPGRSLIRETELYDADQGNYRPLELSQEEQEALAHRVNALNALLSDGTIKAKYKIELTFGKGRSAHQSFPGLLSLWLSGSKFHGGGDDKLYMCPQPNPDETGDCVGVIGPYNKVPGFGVCPKCQRSSRDEELIGEKLFRLTAQNWAQVILNYFLRLDQNSDIYLKYHPTDIRYQTAIEAASYKGGECLAKARNSRGLHIYPLRNIIKDVSNGAELYNRFRAFITA